jgi:hypothetical protein
VVHEERIEVGRADEIMTLDHVLPAVLREPVPGKAQLRACEDRQLQTSPVAAKTAAQAPGLAAIDQVCRLSDKARCDPPNKTFQGLPPLQKPGRSGKIKSQRSCKLCASRRGQLPLSCSFHFIGLPLTAVFRDQLVCLLAALAPALAGFDAQHIELAFDVSENELAARHLERG